jgi:hypothetical protein
MRHHLLLGLAALCAASFATQAKASLVVTLIGNPVAVTGGMDYTYSVTLSADEQLNNTVQSTFFSLYDFGAAKFVGDTGFLATSKAWTFATNANLTTSAQGILPMNDPSILDVRATYTGPIALPTQFSAMAGNLGTFTLFTTDTGAFKIFQNDQDGQLAKYAPGQPTNDTLSSNLNALAEPQGARAIPEPATIGLLGAGLLGLTLARRRMNGRSV